MSQEMYKEKARFVKKLQTFYIRDCKNPTSIKRLDYMRDQESDSEFIYVSYSNGSQKRIYVTGRCEQGLLLAFVTYLSHFDDFFWINPFEASYRKEFTEDE